MGSDRASEGESHYFLAGEIGLLTLTDRIGGPFTSLARPAAENNRSSWLAVDWFHFSKAILHCTDRPTDRRQSAASSDVVLAAGLWLPLSPVILHCFSTVFEQDKGWPSLRKKRKKLQYRSVYYVYKVAIGKWINLYTHKIQPPCSNERRRMLIAGYYEMKTH